MMLFHNMMMSANKGASWNIDTAVYSTKNFTIPSPNVSPQAMTISPDGTKAYVSDANKSIYQYTFGTAFDASTLSYATKLLNTATQFGVGSSRDIRLSADGTKAYVSGLDGGSVCRVFQYTLSTPYDLSTGTYASKVLSPTVDTSIWGILFSPDGLTLFVNGLGTSKVYQYTLSTAWDISTATYATKSYLYSAQDAQMTDMWFSPDGKKLYGIGPNTTKNIYQYTLSTAYDISTCAYASKFFLFSGQTATPSGFAISPDGFNLYLNAAGASAHIYQYTLK